MPFRGSTMAKEFGGHVACTGGLSGQLNDPAPMNGARLQVGYYRKSQGVMRSFCKICGPEILVVIPYAPKWGAAVFASPR